MARSFHQNLAHIIFSTKNRTPLITGDIEGQKEHHCAISFKDEFIAFLERHEIDYDERFVWE